MTPELKELIRLKKQFAKQYKQAQRQAKKVGK
jgi:hypothetical protein